jgi:hypothetical protein
MAATEGIHLSYGTQLGCVSPVKFRFAKLPRSFSSLVPLSRCKLVPYCVELSWGRAGNEGGDR